MARSVTITGIPAMQAALARKAVILKAVAAAGVRAETAAVRDDAEAGAPYREGALKAGVVADVQGDQGTVRSTARHGGFVEFGNKHGKAQPYMAPAAARSRPRFIARMSGGLRKAL